MIRPGLYWLRLSPDSDEWTVGRLTFDGVRLRLYIPGYEKSLSRIALRLVIFGPRLTAPGEEAR